MKKEERKKSYMTANSTSLYELTSMLTNPSVYNLLAQKSNKSCIMTCPSETLKVKPTSHKAGNKKVHSLH